MRQFKILAIEDEPTTQILIQQSLTVDYTLILAPNLQRARDVLAHFRPDLILLDINLPDGNGFDFFNSLKEDIQTKNIPVVFLSLLSDAQTKVQSFVAGAYDYITKPFDRAELVARIAAHCHRSNEIKLALYTPEVFGDLSINREAMQVFKSNGDGSKDTLELSPTEYKLLNYFFEHVGKTLSREQISKGVWNKLHFQSRTIDRHMSSLRKKLGGCGHMLKTVSHSGYLFSLDTEN